MDSIHDKLLTLGDDVVVYSGHGPETTIGRERRTNPFLTGRFTSLAFRGFVQPLVLELLPPVFEFAGEVAG